MSFRAIITNRFVIAAFIILVLYIITRFLAWVLWKPIKTYLFKRQNRLLLTNCKDCVHFYQDSDYNCHCDLMTITGICNPKKKWCYRRNLQ